MGSIIFIKNRGVWEKRANDFPGFWSFYFEQLFHGIPMVSCEGGNVYDDYLTSNMPERLESVSASGIPTPVGWTA